jgi:hypothetical protein
MISGRKQNIRRKGFQIFSKDEDRSAQSAAAGRIRLASRQQPDDRNSTWNTAQQRTLGLGRDQLDGAPIGMQVPCDGDSVGNDPGCAEIVDENRYLYIDDGLQTRNARWPRREFTAFGCKGKGANDSDFPTNYDTIVNSGGFNSKTNVSANRQAAYTSKMTVTNPHLRTSSVTVLGYRS